MKVYVDTREVSTLRMGAARKASGATTTYDVRLAATTSRPGRILASFTTLERAREYASLASDRRWGLVQQS